MVFIPDFFWLCGLVLQRNAEKNAIFLKFGHDRESRGSRRCLNVTPLTNSILVDRRQGFSGIVQVANITFN
jgi:hypothetical protein